MSLLKDSVFISIIYATWETILEAAPWLLFGFLIAGLIHVFLPVSWLKKLLMKPGFGSIFKASIIGIPLPLCSCGIIPVMKSLRERGISKGASASFMTSTPEIGVGAFFLTQGLLGYVFALFRVFAAILSAVLAGTLIETIKEDDEKSSQEKGGSHAAPISQSSVSQSTVSQSTSAGSCCHSHENHSCSSVDEEMPEKKDFIGVLREALYFSFYVLPKDLSVLLLVGFIISGAFAVLLPAEFLTETVSEPFLQMLLALVVSLPLYICATSSTPIVAVLYSKGLSIGAALVFLLAGAATNASAMLAAKKEFGTRGAVYYVGSIIFVSMFFGVLIEYVIPHDSGLIPHPSDFVPQAHSHGHGDHDHHHHHDFGIFSTICGVITLVLLIFPFFYKAKHKH